MMILAATVLAFLGVVLLSLSMKRHLAQLLPDAEYQRGRALAMRGCAYAVLVVGTAVCINAEGVGIGLTLAFGLFSLAHFTVAMLLPYLSRDPASKPSAQARP
ncbi:MAG: DUF3325 domain-containing protein [Pseudomonadota bacterium]